MTIAERRDQLRHDTDRWIRELDGATPRATLSVGVLKKACTQVETLLGACLSVFGPSDDVIRTSSDGKTDHLEKLTLGQCVKLLNMLDRQKTLTPPRRGMSNEDRVLLD